MSHHGLHEALYQPPLCIRHDHATLSSASLRHVQVPKLRFVAFDPATGHKSVLLPNREVILENVGGEFAPILDPARRSELARALLSYTILRRRDRNDVSSPMDVVLPYSGGEHDVRVLKVRSFPFYPILIYMNIHFSYVYLYMYFFRRIGGRSPFTLCFSLKASSQIYSWMGTDVCRLDANVGCGRASWRVMIWRRCFWPCLDDW